MKPTKKMAVKTETTGNPQKGMTYRDRGPTSTKGSPSPSGKRRSQYGQTHGGAARISQGGDSSGFAAGNARTRRGKNQLVGRTGQGLRG